MRSCLIPAALALTLASTAFAQPTATQASRSRDAVAVDPTHHQVLFENEHVRVLRALAGNGDRSAMHTHPPTLIVSLGTSRARLTNGDGTTGIADFTPGQVLWIDGAEHSWQVLAGMGHLIGVEVKAAARGARPAPFTLPATDAVTADPVHHQVLLDTAYVRVLEALAGTGRRSPMHTHSFGVVLISLGRSRVNLTLADGSNATGDLHPGQVLWLDPSSHAWEVVAGMTNAIAVEVKTVRAR